MRVVFGILIAGSFAANALAAAPSDACRLLRWADIASVQPGSLVETKPTSHAAAGYWVSDCFYRMEPFANSVSLELTRRAQGREGRDPKERWNRMFRAERGERPGGKDEDEGGEEERGEIREVRGIEREKAPPRPVEGVGEEAFWIGNRASGVLYARKGHAYVRVSVGGGGSDDEKRGKAAALARKALRRL